MRLLCLIFLLLPHLLPAQTTIAEARRMKTGNVVSLHGNVTAVFGALSFIQDPTAAIGVYNAQVAENDSILVIGKLSKFNGLLEIIADSVTILGHNSLISSKAASSLINHEAELVQLQDISLHSQVPFFYPNRGGTMIKNNDTIHYWIDENTDVPGYLIPKTSNIIGIVGRYGNQFQLMPRSHSDIPNATLEPLVINNNFKVLNWNLEFFGAPKYGPTNDELQLTNVARILNSTQADLMALQEISNDEMFKRLMEIMPGYNGRCSNRYSYSFDPLGDFPPQKLCFAYKTSTVKVIREKILFRQYFDEHPSDMFSSGRLPYLLEIETTGHRLSFANIHGKSGNEILDRTRREFDSKLLKDTLDRYQNVILLGDFNDDVDQSIVNGFPSPYENFLGDSKYSVLTSGLPTTIHYDDMIDHQIISSSLKDYVLNTRVVNPFVLTPLYEKTTSDHLPVMSQFDFTKTVTGIEDSDLKIYPNPTSGDIFLPFYNELAVINSTGSIVLKKKGAQSPVSISDCAPGLYTILIDGQIFRIIKN